MLPDSPKPPGREIMCRGQSDLRGGWQGRKENTARYEKNVHVAPV